MNIETFYPEHDLLKQYIEYYYFQKSDDKNFTSQYYAFPNTLQALNIHQNIFCQTNAHTVKVKGVEEKSYIMILQGDFNFPCMCNKKGKSTK